MAEQLCTKSCWVLDLASRPEPKGLSAQFQSPHEATHMAISLRQEKKKDVCTDVNSGVRFNKKMRSQSIRRDCSPNMGRRAVTVGLPGQRQGSQDLVTARAWL